MYEKPTTHRIGREMHPRCTFHGFQKTKDFNCLPISTLSNSPLRRNRFVPSICFPRRQALGSKLLSIPWPGEINHFCSSSRIAPKHEIYCSISRRLIGPQSHAFGDMLSRFAFLAIMEPRANCRNNICWQGIYKNHLLARDLYYHFNFIIAKAS